MYEINICHLYPDLLNLYGDIGNVIALKKRCEWRNIKVNVMNVSIDDIFTPENYDIILLGGGQDYEQEIIQKDLIDKKGNNIINAIENGKIMLCICGGYQLLGKYYITQEGKKINFLGGLDIWTVSGESRMIGNIITECDFLKDEIYDGKLVGFENHSGKTYLGPSVTPLGTVVKGFGNNGEDGYEGAVYKNTFCSYAHGSLLPKNPRFSDYLLTLALKNKYEDFISLETLDDFYENAAHNMAIAKFIK